MKKKNYRRKFLNFPNLIVDRHSRKYKDFLQLKLNYGWCPCTLNYLTK